MLENILVVEDEPALRETLSYNLIKDGFEVCRILRQEMITPILMLTSGHSQQTPRLAIASSETR